MVEGNLDIVEGANCQNLVSCNLLRLSAKSLFTPGTCLANTLQLVNQSIKGQEV